MRRGKMYSFQSSEDHFCGTWGCQCVVDQQVTAGSKSSSHTQWGGGGLVNHTSWWRSRWEWGVLSGVREQARASENCVFIINMTLDQQSSGKFRLCISWYPKFVLFCSLFLQMTSLFFKTPRLNWVHFDSFLSFITSCQLMNLIDITSNILFTRIFSTLLPWHCLRLSLHFLLAYLL